jgi:hypothetical protein
VQEEKQIEVKQKLFKDLEYSGNKSSIVGLLFTKKKKKKKKLLLFELGHILRCYEGNNIEQLQRDCFFSRGSHLWLARLLSKRRPLRVPVFFHLVASLLT